jgi:hydroxypyruvate reductase
MVVGSDGIDGNSPHAGAVVDGSTWDAISARGIDPSVSLQRCDSSPALEAVGATITTGPTGVNHADLMVVEVD